MKTEFRRINLKADTLERFRGFSALFNKVTHSDLLEAMLDFFDRYQLSPFQEFHTSIRDSEINIKKRINALIAIIKDIEKHQTKPSVSMLQLLFEQTPVKTAGPKLVEITAGETNQEYQLELELMELQKVHALQERKIAQLKEALKSVLDKVKLVKSSFGKPKLLLDITPEALEKLKQQFI